MPHSSAASRRRLHGSNLTSTGCVRHHDSARAQQWQRRISVSNGRAQDELGIKLDGKKLFDKETFGGNGRTCLTCHSKETGTFSLSDVQRIIDKADPDDAFLIHDALDDDGIGTTRVQTHGTIRVTIPLPPWLTLADDPGATHVSVFRGTPSTRNTPALDPVLNHDGRAHTVQEQAREAIHGHYQNTIEPTAAELDAIAEFQRTDPRFFSSPALKRFAATGAPPELPPGITPAEQRGRTFLVDAPFNPPSKRGICALCHSGPMLNMVNQAHSSFSNGSPPVGARFINTGVGIVNAPNNPVRTWIVNDRVNPVVTVLSPDVGLLLDFTPATPPPTAFRARSLLGCSRSRRSGESRTRRPTSTTTARRRFAMPWLTISGSSTSLKSRTRWVRGPSAVASR